uniref:BPTI/Kunitz inhibitor domain-containing protein n=1 Tax=Monodelphis domestica TaxID=13616 RepID=A0A5F8HA00_MONDO
RPHCIYKMEKMDQGPCRAYYLRWFFDKKAMTCEPFVYGGCYGSRNNFPKAEAGGAKLSRSPLGSL